MKERETLVSRYNYGGQYIPDIRRFKEQIFSKTIVPYQVEVQPGPVGKYICWLKCPFCYGSSAQDTGERLSRERYIQIMKEIADGGINKIIFAGYCSDPLNYVHIEDLLEIAIDHKQVFGFNTKALKISGRFIELISTPGIVSKSYFSVSVDAGSNRVYNEVHGIKNERLRLYDRVLENVRRIAEARNTRGVWFDISATYLINRYNNYSDQIVRFVKDFKGAGCNLLRFTFPQLPRGSFVTMEGFVPSRDECQLYTDQLRPVIQDLNDGQCQVIFVDADSEHDIFRKPRTLPCFARFVYPTVGFDGWLYHCSQSAAPNFRKMALGNLADDDFWELFYNYDISNFVEYLDEFNEKMATVCCKCDRKEHLVNESVRKSGVFKDARYPEKRLEFREFF